MSEKLDGVRAYWDGTQFVSRQGNVYAAPEFITKVFVDLISLMSLMSLTLAFDLFNLSGLLISFKLLMCALIYHNYPVLSNINCPGPCA